MKLYITEAGYPEIGDYWKSEEQAAKWYGEHGYPESDVRTDLLDMGYDDEEDEEFIQTVMDLTPKYYKSTKTKSKKPKTFRDLVNLSKKKQMNGMNVYLERDFDWKKYGGDFGYSEFFNKVANLNNGDVKIFLNVAEESLMDAQVVDYDPRDGICSISATDPELQKLFVKAINSKVSRSVKKARKLLGDYLRKEGIDPTDPRIVDEFNDEVYYYYSEITKLKPNEVGVWVEKRRPGLVPKCNELINQENKNESINYTKKKYVKEDLYHDAQKEVYDFFMKKQWDLNIPEVANYADAVAEQLELDPEFANGTYTMRDWYKDTYWSYPEEIEWLNSTAY
jgi:hypothetical protein